MIVDKQFIAMYKWVADRDSHREQFLAELKQIFSDHEQDPDFVACVECIQSAYKEHIVPFLGGFKE